MNLNLSWVDIKNRKFFHPSIFTSLILSLQVWTNTFHPPKNVKYTTEKYFNINLTHQNNSCSPLNLTYHIFYKPLDANPSGPHSRTINPQYAKRKNQRRIWLLKFPWCHLLEEKMHNYVEAVWSNTSLCSYKVEVFNEQRMRDFDEQLSKSDKLRV